MSECGMQWTPAVLHSVTVDRADEALDAAGRYLRAGRRLDAGSARFVTSRSAKLDFRRATPGSRESCSLWIR